MCSEQKVALALVPSERAYLPRVPAPSESVDLVAASFKQMPVTQVRPGTHARLVEQASEGRSKTSPELVGGRVVQRRKSVLRSLNNAFEREAHQSGVVVASCSPISSTRCSR